MKHSFITRRSVLCSLAALSASAVSRDLSNLAVAAPAEADRIRLGAQTNAWPIDPRKFESFLSALNEIKSTGYAGFETGFINLRS